LALNFFEKNNNGQQNRFSMRNNLLFAAVLFASVACALAMVDGNKAFIGKQAPAFKVCSFICKRMFSQRLAESRLLSWPSCSEQTTAVLNGEIFEINSEQYLGKYLVRLLHEFNKYTHTQL
jgi:hypothetical protein